MGKKLKALLALNLEDIPVALGFAAGPWLLVHLVTCVVMLVVRPDESIMISGMMLPFTVGLSAFAVTSGNTMTTFTNAVKFSATRKTALKLTLCQTAIESLQALALGALLLFWERFASMPVWRFLSGNPELLVDDFGFVWWALPLGALVGYLIGLWYGATILKLGSKGYWVFLCIWLGGMTVFQLLPWKTHEITNILSPAACLTLALAVLWSVRTLLRLSITK